MSHCKECSKARARLWAKNNPEKARLRLRRYRKLNPTIIKAIEIRTREKNRERKRAADRAAYKKDPTNWKINAYFRKKRIKQATPKWINRYTKEYQQIKEIYLNKPIGCHVDHIIPLKGKNVSGLHVPWNLQYLTAKENLRKHNELQ